MSNRRRHALMILAVVLISLTLLAAPARGDDWFGIHIGSGGFGLSFGSTDWAVWGASWDNPAWSVDYHAALSGYGEWVWVDGLGQCWLPWVRPDWRPFTYGRWVWTPLGWTWVAYEPWGYFPHHFGYWAMAPAGWVWVPGTSYQAANVVWVSAGPWVGWYPRPPSGWHHHHGYDHPDWAGWDDARYATFVGWRDLGADDLSEHAFGAEAIRAATPRAVLREGAAPPTRHELSARGVAIPEMSVERRTARIGGREAVVARPREAAASVERNARRTVERALAPQAASTLTRHATANRAATPARTAQPVAAPTARDRMTGRDGRSADGRGGRAGALVAPPRDALPAVGSAPSRPMTGATGSRSASTHSAPAEVVRPVVRTGSRRDRQASAAPPADAARRPRAAAAGPAAAPRSSATAAPPSSPSDPRPHARRGPDSEQRQAATRASSPRRQ